MQLTTPKFQDAITRSHNVAVRMDIYTGGSTSPAFSTVQVSGQSAPNVRIVDGSVVSDKTADIRARASIKLIDPTFAIVPVLGTDLLTPFGNEMVLYRGVAYTDGTPPEYVKLGTFRISEVLIDDTNGSSTITVTGFDRSRTVGRYTTTIPYFQAGGVSYPNAIRTMIQSRYPAVIFNDTEASWVALVNDRTVQTVAAVIPEGTNLWTEARKMAATAGCDLFFDQDGICTFYRDPVFSYTAANISVPPVISFIEGQTATFNATKRTLSDTTSFNYMVANGEGGGSSLRSVPAIDDDPNSSTYINGPYGTVNKVVTSPLLVTQSQANDYAQLRLRQSLGAQESAEITGIVNPALEVDDVCAITRARVGLTNISYAISSLTIPLLASASMPVKFRERRALIRGD